MKFPSIFLAALLTFTGCSSLTPQQQTGIQNAERILATAAQVAAPFASDKRLSDALYGVGALSAAYAGQPVPTNIVQATAQLAPVAGVVIPYVSGGKNDAKTTAIINGAAAILAATQSP